MSEAFMLLGYLPGVAAAIPLVFAAGALAAPRVRRTTQVTGIAFAVALVVAAGSAAAGHAGASGSIRLDAVTSVMLVLVCALALVIARYSRSYLRGDPGQGRYERWLLATLAAVTTLVVANDLLLMTVAWSATSLSLHQLLTFYNHRSAALVAAHKKFLVSRLAEACLLAATALIFGTVGSVHLDVIDAWAHAHESLPASLEIAAVLLVAAAALKSAQLPFHGWLTQVMEAPTPVSALLHAGVVNIGGFLMIRLAPLMVKAQVAQALLVGIGLTTTIVAAFVMATRVSVKVALAWSTIAQMGFMLLECGLGAFHLALLHLVAHSLYKAHAFLVSGGTVDLFRARALSPAPRPVPAGYLAVPVVVASGCTAAVMGFAPRLGGSAASDDSLAALTFVLGLSLGPAMVRGAALGARGALGVAFRMGSLLALYAAWHAAAAALVPELVPAQDSPLAWAVVAAAFAGAYALQAVLRARPDGELARYLHPRLFAGLYLDELFTRLTFRVWPPRLASPPPYRPLHVAEILEA